MGATFCRKTRQTRQPFASCPAYNSGRNDCAEYFVAFFMLQLRGCRLDLQRAWLLRDNRT
jgi:hypothetical protein